MKLKDVDINILSELLKNSKISDRKLAEKIQVSQPTVTRRRARLERELSIHYTSLPNFRKLNLEILAFNLVHWRPEKYESIDDRDDFMKRVLEFRKRHPNIIFASDGSGLGYTRMAVSFHKNYTEYMRFTRDFQSGWGEYIEKFESFIVSLKSEKILRLFDFSQLAEYIKTME